MNIIEVDVGKTKLFSIGQQYNNNALAIHFVNLPNQKNKYIYYKIDDVEEEIPLVSDLFIVSRPLTLHSGEVKAQIIVRDETNETIELTKNFTMRIQPSNYSGIGEDENYPDDPNIKNYFVKIDEKVNSFEELANLVQTKLDNGEFVGARGPKGEKGDPGDVTEEYRNLASQIAQNAISAQTSATNAQTSATNAKKALDDTREFANQTKTELNQIKTDTSVLKDEANTSATNAKASEDKAKEYADNLQASTDDISQLKEDLADILNDEMPKNLVKGFYVNTNTGALSHDNEYTATGFIDVSGLDRIIFVNDKKTLYNCFYDANKTKISNFAIGVGTVAIKIPTNAMYVVVSNTNANMESLKIWSKRKTQGKSLDDAFSLIEKIRLNEFPYKTVIQEHVNKANGQFLSDSAWARSEMINIENFASLVITTGKASDYNCFYDSEKNFISSFKLKVGGKYNLNSKQRKVHRTFK